eukprot:5172228-Lingulodinium_polyedra.AAC.1
MKLGQDNEATIRTITHAVTSWRTRHYALRAAWIRDIIKEERIIVEHEQGVEICADPLTKVLGKVKLQEALTNYIWKHPTTCQWDEGAYHEE